MNMRISKQVRAKLSDEEVQQMEERSAELRVLFQMNPPVWYWRFIWCYRIKSIRLFIFCPFKNTRHYSKHIFTPKHFVDLLIPMYPKWWTPPVVGFQVWY